jgi:hypothetical protein
MNTPLDERMRHDLAALADVTRRQLGTIDNTARALSQARARRTGGSLMRAIRKPILGTAVAIAAVAAVLVFPVPYTRTVYDLELTGADGHVTVVRPPLRSAAQAERRAAAARRRGAHVAVQPRTERVWGNVYAMAKDKILQVDVELDGKTDAEIEAQVRDQLSAAGWTPSAVEVEQHDGGSTVRFGADDGAGRHIEALGQRSGDDKNGSMEFPLPDITREPGMTDAELRNKILRQLQESGADGQVIFHKPEPCKTKAQVGDALIRQLKERGLDAQVDVDGKRVEIRALRKVETP